jgi:hypothetical protein
VPNGYEAIKTDRGYDIVPIKIEKTSDEKLGECMKKINNYNAEKEHYYFINQYGTISICQEGYSHNHAPENIIKAEQIQMIWRRLARIYNEKNDGCHGKYVILLTEKGELYVTSYSDIKVGIITFKSVESIYKAIEEIDKENLIFMLNNL